MDTKTKPLSCTSKDSIPSVAVGFHRCSKLQQKRWMRLLVLPSALLTVGISMTMRTLLSANDGLPLYSQTWLHKTTSKRF